MKRRRAAAPYAKELFALAKERDETELSGRELGGAAATFESARGLSGAAPAALQDGKELRGGAFPRAIEDRIDQYLHRQSSDLGDPQLEDLNCNLTARPHHQGEQAR